MHQRHSGFTLLEVLMVVGLLALVTLGGLSLFHLRITHFRIEKTALQMQQWLQAGQNYYSENGAWPTKDEQLKNYLPTNSERNAWGRTITIPTTQIASAPLFQIETMIPPDEDNDGHNSARVAGRLPNAKANASLHQVITEVAAPMGGNATESGQKIISIQNIAMPIANEDELKQKIQLPSDEQCPTATHQTHVFYAIAEAHFNVSKRIPHLLRHIKGLPENWQDAKASLHPNLEARAMITNSDRQEMEDPENYRHVGPDHQFANKEGALLAIVTCEKIATTFNTPPPPHSKFVF